MSHVSVSLAIHRAVQDPLAVQAILDYLDRAGARVRRLGDQPALKRSTLRLPYRMSKGKKRLMPGD